MNCFFGGRLPYAPRSSVSGSGSFGGRRLNDGRPSDGESDSCCGRKPNGERSSFCGSIFGVTYDSRSSGCGYFGCSFSSSVYCSSDLDAKTHG